MKKIFVKQMYESPMAESIALNMEQSIAVESPAGKLQDLTNNEIFNDEI